MGSIRVSKKHGVNPSLEQCFICMKEVGVVLFGELKGDVEAPRKVCLGPNSEPCAECKGWMEKGIILISVDESKSKDMQNPWRSGGFIVVTEDYVRRVLTPEMLDGVLEKRAAFIPDGIWDLIGLPRGEADEATG